MAEALCGRGGGGHQIIASASAQTLPLAKVQDLSLNAHQPIIAAPGLTGKKNTNIHRTSVLGRLYISNSNLACVQAVPENASVWVRCLVVWDG